MKNTIRIAILCGNPKIDFWVYSMLGDFLQNTQIEIVNVILIPGLEHKYSFSFSLYNRFEEKVFKVSPNALEKKDLESLIPHSDIIAIDRPEDFDNVKSYLQDRNLNFIIKLDSTTPTNSLEKIVNGGILFLYHGDLKSPITHSVGTREMLTNQDVLETNLMFLSSNSELSVLKTSKVSRDDMSILRGVNDLLWTSSKLIPRTLQKIIDKGLKDSLKKAKRVYDFNFEDTSYIWKPKNLDLAKCLVKKYFKKTIQLFYSRFFIEQWILLFTLKEYNPLNGTSPKNFTKILPPKDRFWADPFIYRRDNKDYVFFEELVYDDIKGHISVMTINNDGTYTQPQSILKKKYHLSYPFLIEDNEQLYMIPETFENKTIEIYKCVEFPYKWEFVMNLMSNTVAVDTTILKRDSRYWMFTNIQERQGASMNNELFIFYSDNLLSQIWHPHSENPVISDASKARSAGNIFEHNNELYRPAQNCGKHYGYAFSVNKITVLTEDEFEEHEVSTILPSWDKKILSTHTINQLNDLTVIDGVLKIKK